MAAAINAIGVISGILGIVGFGIDNFKDETELSGSVIKVAVALEGPDGNPPTNTGGDLPDVRVWNLYGDFVGITSDPGTVSPGNLGDVQISHDNQNTYSLFSANDDAICVAWVTTTYTDDRGGNKYAVSGDFGRVCGGSWYASGMFPTSDSEYQPDCFWIDGNGDQPNTGFQVRWPSYSDIEYDPGTTDPSTFCDDIKFGLRTEEDPSSINFYIINPVQEEKRQATSRPVWMNSQLVVSDSKSHSAKKLCESATSLGPDFAHVTEKLFCEMGTKKLYPFCDSEATSSVDCFDQGSQVLTTALSRRGSVIPRQNSPYTLVRDWTQKNGTS